MTGLDAGANDYLVKPFALEELLARVRVLLRSTGEASGDCYEVGDLKMYLSTHKVTRGGKEIHLSGKEFSLLRYLMQNAGLYYPESGWKNICGIMIMWAAPMSLMYISVICVKRLMTGRKRKLIHTVRGAGYVLKVENEEVIGKIKDYVVIYIFMTVLTGASLLLLFSF